MSGNVKILFLVHSFGIGGITGNTLNMIKHIDYSKFEVHIAYIKEGPLKVEFERFDIKFLKLGDVYKLKSVSNLTYIGKIYRYIQKEKIQVVHTQDVVLYMVGSISCRLSGIPHVRTQPNLVSVYEKLNTKTINILPFERWTRKYIALNKASAEDLIKIGVNKEKIETIQGYFNNKDLHKSDFNIRQEYNIDLDYKIICSIGRLVEGKGLDIFLKTAKYMLEDNEKLVFLIVGDGTLREELVNLSRELEIEKSIIFTGYRTDIFNIISQIDLGIFPVRTHAGMVEVVIGGNVLISGKSNIMSEYIEDGKNGILIDSDNPCLYAKKALDILKNRDGLEKMKQESRKIYLERMDGINNIRKFERIITDMII